MKFRGHETFFIRMGWLSKGLKNVVLDPEVFMGTNENPMDRLGIGSNMVKSLRYWMQAVGLAIEPSYGRKEQTLTPLGEIIFENDRYLEEIGSLWLLHYKLATNIEGATAWYFLFNEFRPTTFDKESFLESIRNYLAMHDEQTSLRSLEDDFNCILNTYLSRSKIDSDKTHPDNTIDCPFRELGLIEVNNVSKNSFRKKTPSPNSLHPFILLSVIVDQANGSREVKISDIKEKACNAGKIFNLDIMGLTSILYKLELMGQIKVIRTAGLDLIEIKNDFTFEDCVKKYFEALNASEVIINN